MATEQLAHISAHHNAGDVTAYPLPHEWLGGGHAPAGALQPGSGYFAGAGVGCGERRARGAGARAGGGTGLVIRFIR